MPGSRGRKARTDPASPELFRQYAETRDPALREHLVLAHANLARYLASRFANRGEPLEDLIQVAHIGLVQAVDRFDPGREVKFVTYATAIIVGEIKRYFRDKSWSIHVPRRLRELNNALMQSVERLSVLQGRSPTIAELAGHVGVSFEEAVEALEVGRAYSPVSLDAEANPGADEDSGTLAEYVGSEDPGIGRMEDRYALGAALDQLPERERQILQLRYYQGRSQAEIARTLGISQMHVSRLQREALRRLRALIES